jgi:transposase
MKYDKKNYNKLKHYWKLIQKFEDDLDDEKKKYSVYFGKELTDYEIVSYIINTNKELKATYKVYQGILRSIRNKDSYLFSSIVYAKHESISEYMKTTLKSLNKFAYHIIMAFKYNYNNGVIEGINNLIKCIKRIAFGYKSFYHFKTRIMLIAGIYTQ